MIKKISTFLVVSLMLVSFASAQNKHLAQKAPVKMVEPQTVSHFTGQIGSTDQLNAADYQLVDYMANAFGPAISSLNPLVYDPYADVVAIVHRGGDYAGGSGELWYNISTDRGTTWTRVSAINNVNPQIFARYPSMAISNPTKGDMNATTAAFSWPELTTGGAAFGWVGYGADQPVGAGAPFAAILEDEGAYSSQVPTWASDVDSYVFWASDFGTASNAAIRLFRTQDFASVEEIDDPNWASSVFQDNGNITMGGVSFNGTQYYGVIASFVDPDPNDPINYGWYPGYSTSTDDGATWSAWTVIDPRRVPGLEDFDEVYDYKVTDSYVSFCGDINVDNNGYVHIVTALTDTNTANNAIVEIYETANGWRGNVLANGLMDGSFDLGPGLGQMGPSPYIAFDSTRTVMACQWVNGVSASIPWCDVYFSYRTVSGADTVWSPAVNLTESDSINNTATHLAPTLATVDANHFTAFSMYDYVDGVTGPYSDTTLVTNIYIAPVSFETTAVGVANDQQVVNTYSLDQNYPNPFNPATLIKYSVAERGAVSLKVYDILGNEVATLVNASKEAGTYQVNFDASKLSSGVYIYTLNAGNYTQSKKMLLMK